MNTIRDEKKILRYTYLLCIVGFADFLFSKSPLDYRAMIIAGVICLLVGSSHFIIRKFFPDGDKYILIFSAILAVIGIIMLYRLDILNTILHNTDIQNHVKYPHEVTTDAIKQIIWFAVGIAGYIIIVVLFPDLKRFSKYKYVYLVFTMIFMSMALIFGTEINGSKNWILIHGYSFQPSEFGKLFFVAYLASSLMEYDNNSKKLMEPAAVVAACIGLMVLQKDLGSALIFFGISITMLYIATSKLKYVLTCLALFVIGAVISYFIFSHVKVRVQIWKNPWIYANGNGYQVVQSLISIATGKSFGVGLGLGHPEFVPVNSTDFIFAAITEDMGMLMGFAIIILYFLLFYRCMRAAVYAENDFSRLVAVGYSSMIASQVLVIVGGVINAIPLTGITLPLVSYGGSSMIITFFALGILQKISEEGR